MNNLFCIKTGNLIRSVETTTDGITLKEKLEARLDRLPRHGVIYKGCTYKGSWIDTYGRGNFHNSIHQYKPKCLNNWNKPMPFPCDLNRIETRIKLASKRNETIKVGFKSDPFMWLDAKHEVTKQAIKLASKYKVRLELYTMSDLCAHDDYLELLQSGNHSIVMQLGFNHQRLERFASPGAPSRKRRQKAVTKLRKCGVKVTTLTVNAKPSDFERFGLNELDTKAY